MKNIFLLLTILFFFTGCQNHKEGLNQLDAGLTLLKNGDIDGAIEQFEKSCNNGVAAGCHNGGLVLEKEKVNFITKTYYGPEIYEAYEKGCELGDKYSCKKAEKWKEYKDGSFLSWIWWILLFLFVVVILNISGGGKGGGKRRDYTNEADIMSNIDPSDFHPHF